MRWYSVLSVIGVVALGFMLVKNVLNKLADGVRDVYKRQALPGLILNNQPVNGTLADMRNINDSYVFVNEFKRLNWQIIWYKDASGKVIGIQRPKTGW